MKILTKSIKFKLFFAYSSTIFIVLFLLSFLALYSFEKNQETKTLNLLETTYNKVEKIILAENTIDVSAIDNFDDIKNLIIIIKKDNELLYTNKSINITKRIVFKIEKKLLKKNHYFEYDEYIEVKDLVVNKQKILKDSSTYIVYIIINEHILEEFLDDVYVAVMIVNLFLFLLLCALGYFLIDKTIKPLKNILLELQELKNKKDLSKRLKKQNTNDEFEELSDSFNDMLEWIENSVENIKQFTSDASHELRTPLTVIQGEIELCKNSFKTNEELLKVINTIDIEQKCLQNIIKDFLLLSKLDKEVLNNETAYLDKVIFDSIEKNLEEIENKKLELKLDIEESLEINFNEKYLYIVINNLITNAIKYTDKGYISISAKKNNNGIVLSVLDSGMGIDKNDLHNIFERFYRVDKIRTSNKQGLGLGLAIVKKICDRFSYDIIVKSELNKGSEFILKKK